MALFSWSKTAASNSSADGTINWAEGQAPSSVNDSARAMMARTAEWRDDISGALTTAGTSTAYTLTTNQVFDSLAHMHNAMVAFVPHATCGATVTLAVDGLAAKPLRSSPGVELLAGTLILGTPYVATYNNTDSAFYLQSFISVNPYSVPIGGMLDYIGTSAPNSSFVFPFGQAISRTTYATLFALVGTTFGAGDNSTTFNVIDLRGRIAAGIDNMGGSAASRIGTVVTDSATIVGTTLGSVGGSSTHTLTAAESAVLTYTTTASLADSGSSLNINYISPVGGSNDFAAGAKTIHNASQISVTASTSANAGGGSHAIMQPTIMVNKILRVL